MAIGRVTPQTSLKKLNWSLLGSDTERTKHVHGLHPFIGKFKPQLVEVLLRKFKPRMVCDPFIGSGTTMVEALALGTNSFGCDIADFNIRITQAKIGNYNFGSLVREVGSILERSVESDDAWYDMWVSDYMKQWYMPKVLKTLLTYESFLHTYDYANLLSIILSRAARSLRLVKHDAVNSPKEPQRDPYECKKHKKICTPTDDVVQYLIRYSNDTLNRVKEFDSLRKDAYTKVVSGDSATVDFPMHDMVITSPPTIGGVSYHEQHKYAYELLGLDWKDDAEIGIQGKSIKAQEEHMGHMVAVFRNVRKSLMAGGRMAIIVNDKKDLYDMICRESGMRQVEEYEHVEGRRGPLNEKILIWVKE